MIAEAYPLYVWHYTQSDINEDRRSVFKAITDIEYVPMKKAGKKNVYVTARRMHFNRLLDFFIADFFEGIHSGHYPKKCEICGRYFLSRLNMIRSHVKQGKITEEFAAEAKRLAQDQKDRALLGFANGRT